MGIFKKMIANSAKRAVNNMVIRGVDRQITKAASADAIVRKSKAQNKLVATRKAFTFKHDFDVADERDERVYQIKTDRFNVIMTTMRLYDIDGTEIARIIKSPTILGRFAEYEVYLENELLITIDQHDGSKPYFEISPLEWCIQGDFLHWDFRMLNEQKSTLIQIKKAYSGTDKYVIEYDDEEIELFGLLMFMAVELAYHHK